MNWTKFVYHSFLTIILGVTLSVCSNVMETDDFEIEAIANSSTVKYGSATVSSGNNQITFSSSFSNYPVVIVTEQIIGDNSSAGSTNNTFLSDSYNQDNISKSGFTYSCCIMGVEKTKPDTSDSNITYKIYYTAIGN